MNDDTFATCLLPGLPVQKIREAYAAAAGNEIDSGKFANPESSAALAANTFGFFLDRPELMPALPSCDDLAWPATQLTLEAVVRFPWSGGHHPCLDALIETPDALIGVESKRYEPFRSKASGQFSEAYSRPVWGDAMARYEALRDDVQAGTLGFERLDAAQLVKHAFGLRSAIHRAGGSAKGKRAILIYLYAEPAAWPDGRTLPGADLIRHRSEAAAFATRVAGDEVRFLSCSYGELLASWRQTPNKAVVAHASAIGSCFRV